MWIDNLSINPVYDGRVGGGWCNLLLATTRSDGANVWWCFSMIYLNTSANSYVCYEVCECMAVRVRLGYKVPRRASTRCRLERAGGG